LALQPFGREFRHLHRLTFILIRCRRGRWNDRSMLISLGVLSDGTSPVSRLQYTPVFDWPVRMRASTCTGCHTQGLTPEKRSHPALRRIRSCAQLMLQGDAWPRDVQRMVRAEGLEPPRLAAREPKSRVSTSFTTPACTHALARAWHTVNSPPTLTARRREFAE
jgi:hypothetical protein